MSDMDRREFLSKAAQAAGGTLICTLVIENSPAGEVEGKAVASELPVDENFWIGGY